MGLLFCNAVFWKASQNCISSSMVDFWAQALAETYFIVLSIILEMGLTIFARKELTLPRAANSELPDLQVRE